MMRRDIHRQFKLMKKGFISQGHFYRMHFNTDESDWEKNQ